MDNFMKSPNSTPPTSPITSPLNSPSPITSPNLSSESKKILDFLVNCANQDRLKAEILVDDKNKIELKENNNKNNKFRDYILKDYWKTYDNFWINIKNNKFYYYNILI